MSPTNGLSTSQISIVLSFLALDVVLIASGYTNYRPSSAKLYGRVAYTTHVFGMLLFLVLNLLVLIIPYLYEFEDELPWLTTLTQTIGLIGFVLAVSVYYMAAKSYGTRAWTRPGYRIYAGIFALTSFGCIYHEGSAQRTQSVYATWVLTHAYATCRIFVFVSSWWKTMSSNRAYDMGASVGAAICTVLTFGTRFTMLGFISTAAAYIWNTRHDQLPAVHQRTMQFIALLSSSTPQPLRRTDSSGEVAHRTLKAVQQRPQEPNDEFPLEAGNASKKTPQQPRLNLSIFFLLISLPPFCFEVLVYLSQGKWLYLGFSRISILLNAHQTMVSIHVICMFAWVILLIYQFQSKSFPSHRISGGIASLVLVGGLLLGTIPGLGMSNNQLYCFPWVPLMEGQAIIAVFTFLMLSDLILLIFFARENHIQDHLCHVKSIAALTSAVGVARAMHVVALVTVALLNEFPSLEIGEALFDFRLIVPSKIDAVCFSVCTHLPSFFFLLYAARQNSKTMRRLNITGIMSFFAAAVALIGAMASLAANLVTLKTVTLHGIDDLSLVQSRFECAQ